MNVDATLIYWHRLNKLYDLLREELLKQFGITQIESEILVYLAFHEAFGEAGGDTASDIAESRILSKSNVSKGVYSLMKKGFLVGEQDERDRREALEERHLQALLALERLHDGKHRVRRRVQFRRRRRRAVHEEALGERDEMRRRVTADAIACRTQHGVEHGRDRALAVRAGDMNELQGVLRIPQRVQQGAHRGEPRAHAVPTTRRETFQKTVWLHGRIVYHIFGRLTSLCARGERPRGP